MFIKFIQPRTKYIFQIFEIDMINSIDNQCSNLSRGIRLKKVKEFEISSLNVIRW